MASNEEILEQIAPGSIWASISDDIYKLMDAARKDEVEAWEKFKRVHYVYSVIRHDMTVGFFYKKVCYSLDELYTIFKQKTIKYETKTN